MSSNQTLLLTLLLGMAVFIPVLHASPMDDFVQQRLNELDDLRFKEDTEYWPKNVYPPLK